MSFEDMSSLSDTDSVYQDLGLMSPPLSPKHVKITEVDVHMPPSHVQLQSQRAHTQDMGTQYIGTKSVSCDTHDIDTQLRFGEDYSMQSFIRPCSQSDRGYFTSTPYMKERSKHTTTEVSRDSRINPNPQMISHTQFTSTSLAVNRVIDTVCGVNPSYTLSNVTPPQQIMGSIDSTERKITPALIPQSTVGIVSQTSSASSNQAFPQQAIYTPTGAGITYIPETLAGNISYSNFDGLSSQMTNARILEAGNTLSNVPTEPSSISLRPRGLSVTFDPNLSYQTAPSDNQNTTYCSFNTEASSRTTNATSPHVLPDESIYQYSNARLPGGQVGYHYPNQLGPTIRSDVQHLNTAPENSVQVPGGQLRYFRQIPPVSSSRLDIHHLNTDSWNPVQVTRDKVGYFCQNQSVPMLRSDNRTSVTIPQSLSQVPGELTQGFASLNVDSFGLNANQTDQASSNYGVSQQNFNSNEQTLLNAASAEQLLSQLSRILGVSGLSLSNANPQVNSTVSTVQPHMQTVPQVSSTVTTAQPQIQTSVIQPVPTPNSMPVHTVLTNPSGQSATLNTLSISEQGKTKILEPDSFDGSEKGPEISEYLIHFEQIALWNRWGPEQKARMLSIKLKGEAQKLLSTLTLIQLSDYETLKEALLHRFNPKERQLAYWCEFRNRRRQANENPVEFGSALRGLGRKAYPDLPVETLEVHLVDQYVMGLGSLDLQKHVQLQHPKNLDQAVNLALEYTAICNVNSNKVMKPSLLDSDDTDKITAVTSLKPLESNLSVDYEKSMTQIFQKVLDKSLEKVLDKRESNLGADNSNSYHGISTQRARSPSPYSGNPGRGYGTRVSFNEETIPKRKSPKKIICTYCKKFNHTENFCRKKHADEEKRQQNQDKDSLNGKGLTQNS